MKRQFAISDIHGCKHSLLALLEHLAFSKSDELYLLGDYIDRGPDSKGVIDAIWQMQREGYTVHCLMGNHEQIALNDWYHEVQKGWIGAGDERFLASFDTKRCAGVPAEYYHWMENLAWHLEIPGYILVHAGLNFEDLDRIFEDKNSLIWIRNWYNTIDYAWLGDRSIVHGHTPMHRFDIMTQYRHWERLRVLDIDAGCSTIGRDGHLCALDMTDRILHFQKRVDF